MKKFKQVPFSKVVPEKEYLLIETQMDVTYGGEELVCTAEGKEVLDILKDRYFYDAWADDQELMDDEGVEVTMANFLKYAQEENDVNCDFEIRVYEKP